MRVSTPTLELRGAIDELLDQLAEVVRAGKSHADSAPRDDPTAFWEPDRDLRVARWDDIELHNAEACRALLPSS